MKVIFLDIDGVLNSEEYLHNEVPAFGENQIDPQAVDLLNQLVSATGASIVISSSWRHIWPFEKIGQMLAQRGFEFSDRVIDKTPDDWHEGFRGNEIEQWLALWKERLRIDEEAEAITSYVIIDDASDFNSEQMCRFVHTNFSVGLTPADVQKATKILNRG